MLRAPRSRGATPSEVSSARARSAGARWRLVEQLIASLDGEDETDAEELWLREAEERYRAYQQGKVESRPADEALRDARSSLE